MDPTPSRRQFLRSLAPRWLNARNLVIGCVGVGIYIAASATWTLVYDLGMTGILRLGLVAAALIILLWLVAMLAGLIGRIIRQGPV